MFGSDGTNDDREVAAAMIGKASTNALLPFGNNVCPMVGDRRVGWMVESEHAAETEHLLAKGIIVGLQARRWPDTLINCCAIRSTGPVGQSSTQLAARGRERDDRFLLGWTSYKKTEPGEGSTFQNE